MLKRLMMAILLAILTLPAAADMQAPASAQRTAGLSRLDGFISMYVDSAKGRILFEAPPLGEDVLYFLSFATSPGSVELGMDRGVTNSLRRLLPGEDSAPMPRSTRCAPARPASARRWPAARRK